MLLEVMNITCRIIKAHQRLLSDERTRTIFADYRLYERIVTKERGLVLVKVYTRLVSRVGIHETIQEAKAAIVIGVHILQV